MMGRIFSLLFILALIGFVVTNQSHAQGNCVLDDRLCVANAIRDAAPAIENAHWRDQTYRDLAGTYTGIDAFDTAIALIDSIESHDIQAITIRNIATTLSRRDDIGPEIFSNQIKRLKTRADLIEHASSNAIAYTYIAMAQSFAGYHAAGIETAASIENEALRHKALGEIAEIQAEHSLSDAAARTINNIKDPNYTDKANRIVSKILSDQDMHDDALDFAERIKNPYQRAQAMQYVMDQTDPLAEKKLTP